MAMAMVHRDGHMAMVRRHGYGHGPVARVTVVYFFQSVVYGDAKTKTKSTLGPDFWMGGVYIY